MFNFLFAVALTALLILPLFLRWFEARRARVLWLHGPQTALSTSMLVMPFILICALPAFAQDGGAGLGFDMGFDMGFDPGKAGAAALGLLVTKLGLYPLATSKKRDVAGKPTDVFRIPEDLQGLFVTGCASAITAGAAVFLKEAILPAISAVATGILLARNVHEAGVRKRD